MSDKKKFKDTNAGKIIGGIIRGAVREIPVVGGVLDNLQSTENGKGQLVRSELTGQIIAGGLVLISLLHGLGLIEQTAFELISSLLTALI